MAYILVQHSVEYYERWKSEFDAHRAAREAAGSKGGFVFRDADNPNNLTVLLEWNSLERAHAFSESYDLREAMKRAGVTGPPTITYLENGGRPTA